MMCELLRGFKQGIALAPAPVYSAVAPTPAAAPTQRADPVAQPPSRPSSRNGSACSTQSADDMMARLAADADAAMAADFADTWAAAAEDSDLRLGPVIDDPDALAAPLQHMSLQRSSETLSAASVRITIPADDSNETTSPERFWHSLCPGLRSALRSAVLVLESAAALSGTAEAQATDDQQ